MIAKLTKPLIVVLFVLAFLLATTTPVLSANKPPPQGGVLPPLKLAVPEDAQKRSYLGLADEGHFTVPQIEADVVIIEIFNMY